MQLYHKSTGKKVNDLDRISLVAHCRKRARLKAIVCREQNRADGQFAKMPSNDYPKGLVRVFCGSEWGYSWTNPELWGLEWKQ